MSHFNVTELFMDTVLADIIFVVDKEEIPGHRLVLAKQCEYFQKLLYSGFKESQSNQVEISGTSTKVFKEFMRFIYLRQLETANWTMEDLLGLLSLAHEYQFEPLFSEVMKAVEKEPLDFDSWKLVHSAANTYESQKLKEKCAAFAQVKIKDFLALKDLDKFSAEFSCFMFGCSNISTLNQDQLLTAICKWKTDKSTSEIMSLFQEVSWEKVSPGILATMVKELFSLVKIVDEDQLRSQVETVMRNALECVARYDNVLLKMNQKVVFPLPKYQISVHCTLSQGYILFQFLTNSNSAYEIPLKRIEWLSSDKYVVDTASGYRSNGNRTDMVVSEPTASNDCFKYSANHSDTTLVCNIYVYSQHFKDVTEIRLKSLVFS